MFDPHRVANDYDFREVFAKQVCALGRPGDLAWGISTSGNSANVVRRARAARGRGLKTLALSGGDGGPVAAAAALALTVPSRNTPRVQEVHITIGHVLCDLVDYLALPGEIRSPLRPCRAGAPPAHEQPGAAVPHFLLRNYWSVS